MNAISNLSIFSPLFLSIKLALITVLILLIIGMPLAFWLARTRSRIKPVIEAIVTMPLILPPTVLGFYLLLLISPNGPVGNLFIKITGEHLAFSFNGLVLGSIIYSMPFVIQPIQLAFEGIHENIFEAAQSLGASAINRFFTIAVPLAKEGILTATVLGVAHTLGEFGVVLMIGGNIPGKTQVVSIAIYDYVEAMEYQTANLLSTILIII